MREAMTENVHVVSKSRRPAQIAAYYFFGQSRTRNHCSPMLDTLQLVPDAPIERAESRFFATWSAQQPQRSQSITVQHLSPREEMRPINHQKRFFRHFYGELWSWCGLRRRRR